MSDNDDIDDKLSEMRQEESKGNRLDRDNPESQPDFVLMHLITP